jgi:hypothetical protein
VHDVARAWWPRVYTGNGPDRLARRLTFWVVPREQFLFVHLRGLYAVYSALRACQVAPSTRVYEDTLCE